MSYTRPLVSKSLYSMVFYDLTMTNQLIIVNPHCTQSDEVVEFLKRKGLFFLRCGSEEDLNKIIKSSEFQNCESIVICGGDGTINQVLNKYMHNQKNKNLIFGIIPCGKANDLAKELNIPFDFEKAYQRIQRKRIVDIDLIQVNSKFFITGGGFGLPTEVVRDVDTFSKKFKSTNKIIKDLIYYFFVLKNVLFGYKGVETISVNKDISLQRYMLISVMNQKFIGKRFSLAPSASKNDGKLDLCTILKPTNSFRSFSIVQKIIKGEHINLPDTKIYQLNETEIKTKEKTYFMADGELLEKSDIFIFKVLPKSLSVFY